MSGMQGFPRLTFWLSSGLQKKMLSRIVPGFSDLSWTTVLVHIGNDDKHTYAVENAKGREPFPMIHTDIAVMSVASIRQEKYFVTLIDK